MKIETKYITINRNIKKVEKDFFLLTDNDEPEDITKQIKIFHGRIDGKYFSFKGNNYFSERSIFNPMVYGELIGENSDTTLIKIDVHMMINHFPFICIVLLLVYLFYSLIKILLEWSENSNIGILISLLFVFFGIPIGQIISNLYSIKKIIEDINSYEEGYLDIYLK